MTDENGASSLPEIRVPARLTFAGLLAGIAAGLLLRGTGGEVTALSIAQPVGALWLRALQMTILPLVVGLPFTGIIQAVAAARAGPMARATLTFFAAVLTVGTVFAAFAMPALLAAAPVPESARAALAGMGDRGPADVPGLADFASALVPANVVTAAAGDAMLPVIAFTALFALAASRLASAQRERLAGFFAALAAAMMVLVGWVLALAPVGVFALALGLAASAGAAAIAALAHYIALVGAIGLAVLLAAYGLGVFVTSGPGVFARAMLPAQAVAFSTQSSLASLPAMLAACRRLGLSQTSAEFVLPLAVAVFRATSPAMNLAVAIYAAHLAGTPLTPATLAAGAAVALLTTLGSVSLPGTVSFIASTGPIALAMGVPVGPLALLLAVEMLPDIVRTVGNVTMDVAVTAAVDRRGSR